METVGVNVTSFPANASQVLSAKQMCNVDLEVDLLINMKKSPILQVVGRTVPFGDGRSLCIENLLV